MPICRDVRRIEPVSPIAEPKASGYRALHVIVRREGYPIEVQLRSVLQDAWANQVEEDGRTIGVGLKLESRGDESIPYDSELDRRSPKIRGKNHVRFLFKSRVRVNRALM